MTYIIKSDTFIWFSLCMCHVINHHMKVINNLQHTWISAGMKVSKSSPLLFEEQIQLCKVSRTYYIDNADLKLQAIEGKKLVHKPKKSGRIDCLDKFG